MPTHGKLIGELDLPHVVDYKLWLIEQRKFEPRVSGGLVRLEGGSCNPVANGIMQGGLRVVRYALNSGAFCSVTHAWPDSYVSRQSGQAAPDGGGTMASTRRRKLKKLRMKKANHGKRPLAGK